MNGEKRDKEWEKRRKEKRESLESHVEWGYDNDKLTSNQRDRLMELLDEDKIDTVRRALYDADYKVSY